MTPAAWDGKLPDNWLQHQAIDPSLRSSKTLAGIRNVPEMALMLENAQKLVGKKGAIIPTDPADKAAVDAYFRAVGWPEKPESYPAPTLPEGLAADPEVDKQFRAWAHELHYTPEQYKGLMERIAKYNLAEKTNAAAEETQALNAAKAALQTKLGSRYDYGIQLANTAAAAFADEKLLERMKAKGWLDDPDFVEYNMAVGEAVSPDRLHANRAGQSDTRAIADKIRELETSDAYLQAGINGGPKHPRHDAVTQQVLALRNQLHNTR